MKKYVTTLLLLCSLSLSAHMTDSTLFAAYQREDMRVWKNYIDSRRIEITCGEAPYIVSRYDAATGKAIEIKNRIGILDRKLRVVSENTTTSGEWLDWARKAYMHTYGYEWQGDNLLRHFALLCP